MSLLHARNIYKSYDTLQVLNNVDIAITQGEVMAITGVSGAGKSTLLHILGMLDVPDQGKILMHGEEILSKTMRNLSTFRNRHIGFVFQFHNLLPEFSALENVMMPGLIGGFPKSEVKKKALQLMVRLGLQERQDHKPSQMSGGECQRTAVARALINAPSLILADEPSGNLDSKNALALHELFFELNEELNHTFVIVTHDHELADRADRKIEMKDGVIISNHLTPRG